MPWPLGGNVHTTDWYPHCSERNRNIFLQQLCALRNSGDVALWADRDADGRGFYHIEWPDVVTPGMERFCEWLSKQPRLTPHPADAACAQAGEVDGETRGAADV